MSTRPSVVTMKWGTLFGPEYVNVLHRACRANTTLPFDFICMTDDPTGLDADIIALPLPDIGFTRDEWFMPGVWSKLALYKRNLFNLSGRCIFIDLDMMVLKDFDALLSYDAPFVTTDMGESWRPGQSRKNPEAGTCLFAFNFNEQEQILTSFLADKAAAKANFENEQHFAGHHASSMDYWPEGWVISFKRWLRQPIGLDLFLEPKAPPADAKVLAFHGTPRPWDLIRSGWNHWDRFPHMGHGRVSWVAEYWKRYGGSISG